MNDTYFIGYDAREHEAAAVAAYSIARRANSYSRIYILDHMVLRKLGLFWREWTVGRNGQFYDCGDERPFSTAFSHSRFLAFHLANELKCTGPCMFIDCDWVFLNDPTEIMRKQQEEFPNEIGVVMRTRRVEEGSMKMDGMVQNNYHRKLWSAMFTFMPHRDLGIAFSPDVVNSQSGRELHNFLGLHDNQFWEIDPAWHYIPSLDERPPEFAKGIHFSEFSPWLNPARRADYPAEFSAWEDEYREWLRHSNRVGNTKLWRDLELDLSAAAA